MSIEYFIIAYQPQTFRDVFSGGVILSALFGFIGGVLTVLVFKLLEWMGEKRLENTEKKKQPQENEERSLWKGEHLCLNWENEEIN